MKPPSIFKKLREYFVRSSPQRTDHEKLVRGFREFVNMTLEHYRFDLEKLAEKSTGQELYERFWKTFYDEVLGEAQKLHRVTVETSGESEELTRELQLIVEKGLEAFKAQTIDLSQDGKKPLEGAFTS